VKRVLSAETVTDERFLMIPLVVCERGWAYAMELRGENTAGSRPQRRQAVRKLAGALTAARQLVALCEARANEGTIREARAYLAFIEGSYLLEKRDFAAAHAMLESARGQYEALGKTGSAALKAACADSVDDLGPAIEYAAYCMKKKPGSGSDAAAALLEAKLKEGPAHARALAALDASGPSKGAAASSSAAASSTTASATSSAAVAAAGEADSVTWRGQAVAVKNEKVKGLLLAALSAERDLHADQVVLAGHALESEGRLLDEALLKWTEAREAARDRKEAPEVEEYTALRAVEIGLRRTELMLADLRAKLASSETPADQMPRPADLVRLCESLTQGIHDRASLLGEADPASPESPSHHRHVVVRARRCLYLGLSFLENEQFGEAIALVDRASGLVAAVPSAADLAKELGTTRCIIIAKYNLHDAKLSKSLEEDTVALTLRETTRRTKYPKLRARLPAFAPGTTTGDPALVDFPPAFLNAPCKPLFFDQAWEYLAYPTKQLEERVAAKGATGAPTKAKPADEAADESEEEKPAASAGGGWFSSLWGGGKKK
jgi:signal recognition particle subunit SRP68